MGNFTVYNAFDEILRTGSGPDECIPLQAQTDEFVIAQTVNPETQKIVDHLVFDKTQTEIDEYRLTRQHMKRLYFTGVENDKELNQIISDHFYALIDVVQWRVENYALLRKAFYPPIDNFNDAQVKKKHTDKYGVEGADQEELYLIECEAVKLRFPKE